MRMEMLSDQEEKVIDALRSLAKAKDAIRTSSRELEVNKELEDILYLLNSTPQWEIPELLSEVTRRIYNLLH